MTYLESSISRSESKPVECYQFISGSIEYFYTDAEIDWTIDSQVFTHKAISRTEPSDSEDTAGQVQITLPLDDPLIQFFLQGPSRPIDVKIFKVERDVPDEPILFWMGQVANSAANTPQDTLICDPVMAQWDLDVPRLLAQRLYCAWTTFDPETCGLDPDDFTFTGNVTAASTNGLVLTIPGLAAFAGADAFYFRDGILRIGEFEIAIEDWNQANETVLLYTPVPNLQQGDEVDVVAGDDRTDKTCHDRFGNSIRRMAFRNMPVVNPFYGQGFR